ncbi:MAG TPA: hypothetical protein DHV39_12510 [Verrucomicrobiales bacterium]|nr:hypothetical protein [Verrucomicrobiales bacterium]HCP37572.1 hypothetical protein [Verrucomicrobiales bacterium]HCZ04210.1 hypothetical protein [Verrucomicrobiales bacterium]|tara:strand:- start:3017 stop:3319 length:303 start_codon:yes stop_codon:yes gene_type:complete
MAYFDLRNANLPATHCVQTHAAGAIRMMITDIEPINCGSIKKLRKILPDFDRVGSSNHPVILVTRKSFAPPYIYFHENSRKDFFPGHFNGWDRYQYSMLL